MRRLLLTTAAVIALGLGGIGFANAHGTANQQSGISNGSPTAASTSTTHPRLASTHARRTMKMSRTQIKQAQLRLRADKLYRGRIDGKFGPQTKTALRRFQQHNKLPVTARLDRRTTSQLLGGTMGQGTSTAPKRSHAGKMGQGKMGQGTSAAPTPGKTQAGQGSSMPPNSAQMPGQSGQNPTNLGTGTGASTPTTPNPNPGTTTNTNPGTTTNTNPKY